MNKCRMPENANIFEFILKITFAVLLDYSEKGFRCMYMYAIDMIIQLTTTTTVCDSCKLKCGNF